MKMKWIFVSLLALLVLTACPQGADYDMDAPEADVQVSDDGSGDSGDPKDTGNVTIRVPQISSYLAQALGISYAYPASRAIMIVSKVDFTLYDSTPAVVDSWTYTSPVGEEGPSGGWGETLTSRNVSAAAGYTLQADVYNNEVSSVTPLLSGTSEAFDVTTGSTTEVVVRPLPISPGSLTVDTTEAISGLTSTFWDGSETDPDGIPDNGDEFPQYTWGEELWFEIDNSVSPLDVIDITASPDASSGVYFMVADSDGRIKTMAMSGGEANGGAWVLGEDAVLSILTPDPTYYIGMISISGDGVTPTGSSIESDVDLIFTEGSDDIYEENDSMTEAAVIAKATAISGVNLDEVDWDGDPDGGDWYKFTITASDDESDIDICLVFDHDQGNLDMRFYDSSGTQLASANSSEASGDSTLEQEDIEDQVLTQGGNLLYLCLQ